MSLGAIVNQGIDRWKQQMDVAWVANKPAAAVMIISQCAIAILLFQKSVLSIFGADTPQNENIRSTCSIGVVVFTVTFFGSAAVLANSLNTLTPQMIMACTFTCASLASLFFKM